MAQIAYSGSSGYNSVRHVTYLPISPQGRSRFEISYRGNLRAAIRIQNWTHRKIITYQPSQTNLPIGTGTCDMWPAVSLLSSECHRTSLIRNQYWFRKWLGVVRQQVLPEPMSTQFCYHMASLGHNELIPKALGRVIFFYRKPFETFPTIISS